MQEVMIELTDAQVERLESLAEPTPYSIGFFVRMAVDQYFKKHDADIEKATERLKAESTS